MKWLQSLTIFVLSYVFILGFVVGVGTFVVIFLVYLAPISADTPLPQGEIIQRSGLSYATVCKPDTTNMTESQIDEYAQRWIGQQFSGWRGWIYNVASQGDGTYTVEISMYGRGRFLRRDVLVERISSDLAMQLNMEQPIMFSGRIARVEKMFQIMCNPLVIDQHVLVQ